MDHLVGVMELLADFELEMLDDMGRHRLLLKLGDLPLLVPDDLDKAC